ncbi:hypothetical protein, partial [Helicobacter salomonis]|uniref:hypothetical protein n=1 Tax=Helicobacter salomonis TaxID=56878 RepID=UPI001F180848
WLRCFQIVVKTGIAFSSQGSCYINACGHAEHLTTENQRCKVDMDETNIQQKSQPYRMWQVCKSGALF